MYIPPFFWKLEREKSLAFLAIRIKQIVGETSDQTEGSSEIEITSLRHLTLEAAMRLSNLQAACGLEWIYLRHLQKSTVAIETIRGPYSR